MSLKCFFTICSIHCAKHDMIILILVCKYQFEKFCERVAIKNTKFVDNHSSKTA